MCSSRAIGSRGSRRRLAAHESPTRASSRAQGGSSRPASSICTATAIRSPPPTRPSSRWASRRSRSGRTAAGRARDGSLISTSWRQAVDRAPLDVNIAPWSAMARSGAWRGCRIRIARPDAAGLQRMAALLDAELRAGMFGLSFGLEYVPGIYSETPELAALGRVVARHDRVAMSHMRSENDDAIEASIDELIASAVRRPRPYLASQGGVRPGRGARPRAARFPRRQAPAGHPPDRRRISLQCRLYRDRHPVPAMGAAADRLCRRRRAAPAGTVRPSRGADDPPRRAGGAAVRNRCRMPAGRWPRSPRPPAATMPMC